MKNKLSVRTKVLMLVAAAGLILVLYTPIWRIDLDAPQYPEGLNLKIHANGLRGNVDIINGLNHYIGMKTLHNEDFVEFSILPYIIIFFSILFLAVALLNKRILLYTAFILFVLFGIIAMYDFWRWEYNYGHNLDSNAAIIVPGMAYQPPLIGFKQLLNFGAYSIPDTGGWIFIGAGLIALFCVITEWRKFKKFKLSPSTALLLLPILQINCSAGPETIVVNKDNCYFCKMTISDVRYAAELLTKKGKVYKFDDIHCLLSFSNAKIVEPKLVKDIYVVDFVGNHKFVIAVESFLLQGGEIRSPMNGNVIAFKDKDSGTVFMKRFNATATTWQQLNK